MNATAAARPIVRHETFEGEDWLFFKAIVPTVAIIRATTADERGNLTYEHEGAFLGPLDLAMAVHNNGGIVIAQVRQIAENETIKPHQVRVPGILVDYIVEAPDQWQFDVFDEDMSAAMSAHIDQEDTILLGEDGNMILTPTPDWPMEQVELPGLPPVLCPLVLVR